MQFTPQPGLKLIGAVDSNTQPEKNANALYIGRVMLRDPESDCIDVELINGGRLKNVPIVTGTAGRNFGTIGIPPVSEVDPLTMLMLTNAQDIGYNDTYAIIAFLHGATIMPVCIGFLPPKISEFTGRTLDGDLKRPLDSMIRRDGGAQTHVSYIDGTHELLVRGGVLRIGPNATRSDARGRDTTLPSPSPLRPQPDPVTHPDYNSGNPDAFLDPSGFPPQRAGFWFANDNVGAHVQIDELGAFDISTGATPIETIDGTLFPASWGSMYLRVQGGLTIDVGTSLSDPLDPASGLLGDYIVNAEGDIKLNPGTNKIAEYNGERIAVFNGSGGNAGVLNYASRTDHLHTFGAESIAAGSVISDLQHGSRAGGSLHSTATTGTAGFMSSGDKSKLDSLSLSSGSSLNLDGHFRFEGSMTSPNVYFPDTAGVLKHAAYLDLGQTFTSPMGFDDMAEFKEMAAPSTPSANHARLYAKDKSGVSTLYWKDDGGTEYDLSLAGAVVSLTSGVSGTLPAANGGTGVNNGSFQLTVPATGTAAIRDVANTFLAAQTAQISDAATNTVVTPFTMQHRTSGTPVAGFGAMFALAADSDTNTARQMTQFISTWTVATDATRTSRLRINAVGSGAAQEGVRIEGGATAMIGFLGAAAVVRPAAYTLTGSAVRALPTDPSGAYTGIATGVGGTPYAQLTDLNTLRTAVSTLLGVVRQLLTDLGNTSGFGLLAA